MKFMNRLNINQKIFAAIVVALLFLASVLGWIIWESLTKMMAEELKKRGSDIAANIAIASADYILVDDYYAIHLLITRAQESHEDVRYILVTNSSNNLISHTFSSHFPKGLLKAHPPAGINSPHIATLVSDEGTIYDILVPIEEGNIGYVRIGMTDKFTRDYVIKKIGNLIYATLLVCLGAAGIAFYVTRLITRPVNELVDVATGISAGNLSLRAKKDSDDEVGKLAQAFNEMADNLISYSTEKELLLKELQEKDSLRDKLISKLITAQEDERKRLSRELHDETSQALTSLMVTMRVLADEAQDIHHQESLYASRDIAASILRDIRDLAVELRPPILDDMGLIPAINKYVSKYKQRYSLAVDLFVPEEDTVIDGHTAVALYRILQEGLTNIVKHTSASRVTVALDLEDGFVRLLIHDNGHGIQQSDLEQARQQSRIGIYGMQERAELLGGTFVIQTAGTGGTELIVSLPLQTKRRCNDESDH